MQRRTFIKNGLVISGGLLSSAPFNLLCASPSDKPHSTVVISRDVNLQSGDAILNTDILANILDRGLQTYFNCDRPLDAWKRIVRPEEVVGLKVNCLSGRYGGTHPELVDVICERLLETGIPSENIVIWDRSDEDLEEGGFSIRYRGKGIRCFGNNAAGFESDFEISGQAASLITRTLTKICDAVINLPVLKDHGIAGMTMSLKNMFGAIHNPNKYHLNVGDPYIADVYTLPSIREKIRLTICDAIRGQYEGGPSYMPQWGWKFNGLLIGEDPVALDTTGWQLIEEQRLKHNLKSLRETGREPTYLATAADPNHRLGTNNPDLINIIYT